MNKDDITRRSALEHLAKRGVQLGGVAIAVPCAISFAADTKADGRPLPLPAKPMRLTRVLTRDLRGSAQLRVSRAWQVEFAELERAIAVSGMQISARVDAPPQLAQMAQLEEGRDTSDIFPILLSENGVITAAGPATRPDDLNEAVARAQALIADTPIPDDEKAQHHSFLTQLQLSGASLFDQMPPDLFFPAGRPVQSRKEISLPGGLTGEFEILYEAFTRPGTPWLHRAVRTVITQIGGDARRSIEEWGLEPLGDANR